MTVSGFVSSSLSYCFHPDGDRILVTKGRHSSDTVTLAEADTGKTVWTVPQGRFGSVYSSEFNSDGTCFLTGVEDRAAILRETESGDIIKIFQGHPAKPLHSMAVSPDGRYLAAGCGRKLYLWDLTSGEMVRSFEGHAGKVSSLAFFPDGESILSASDDWTVRTWDMASGKEIRALPSNELWYARALLRSEPTGIAVFPDGDILTLQQFALKRFDPATGVPRWGNENRTDTIWRPPIHCTANHILLNETLIDAATGDTIRRFREHFSPVVDSAISPDGQYAVAACDDATVKRWEIATGKLVQTFKGHSGKVLCVAIDPDCRRILSASEDRTIRLWDIDTGNQIMAFPKQLLPVRKVLFHPKKGFALSMGEDHFVKLWNFETGDEICRFIVFEDEEWVAMTPEGYYTASPGGHRYINIRTGPTVEKIEAYRETYNRPDAVRKILMAEKSGAPSHEAPKEPAPEESPEPAPPVFAKFEIDEYRVEKTSTSLKVTDQRDGRVRLSMRLDNGPTVPAHDSRDYGENDNVSIKDWCFSPDGKFVLIGIGDTFQFGSEVGWFRIYDLETGEKIDRNFESAFRSRGILENVRRVDFSTDGRYFMVDYKNADIAVVWDFKTGKVVDSMYTPRASTRKGTPAPLKRDPSGASGTETGTCVNRCSSEQGFRLVMEADAMLSGLPPRVSQDADAKGHKRLDSAADHSESLPAYKVQIGAGDQEKPFEKAVQLKSLTFSPDGAFLMVEAVPRSYKDYYQNMALWDLLTVKPVRRFTGKGPVVFSPDNRYALAGGSKWDLFSATEIDTIGGDRIWGISGDANWKKIVIGEHDSLVFLDSETGKRIKKTPVGNLNESIRLSPDGKTLVTGDEDIFRAWELLGAREKGSPASGADNLVMREIRSFRIRMDNEERAETSALSFDAEYALIGTNKGSTHLFEIMTGRKIRSFSGHAKKIMSVSFSADGSRFASGGWDKTVIVWDIASGEKINEIKTDFTVLAISPNGKIVATAGKDRCVNLWNADSGEEICRLYSFCGDAWTAVTPEGYYDAAPEAEQYMSVNEDGQFLPVEGFKEIYHRPEKVREKLIVDFPNKTPA